MKRLSSAVLCLGFVSTLTLHAAEAQVGVQTREGWKPGVQVSGESKAINRIDKASYVIGMDVRNPQHEKLGDIKDLMIDSQTGRIIYAVLGTGGFLGVGDKLLAIPPSAFTASQDNKYFMLNADKQALLNAPGFDRHNWPAVADARWSSSGTAQMSSRPLMQGEVREPAGAERPATNLNVPLEQRGEWKPGVKQENRAEVRVNEPAGAERQHAAVASSGENSGWVRGTHATGTTTVEAQPGGAAVSTVDRNMIKAGSLMGMNVKNTQGEKLGEIEDLAIDLHSGQVRYAVMSNNALLGMRDRLYAVPLDAMKRGTEANTMILNADAAMLRNTPGFTHDNWPAQADARFHGSLEQHGTAAATGINEPSGAEHREYKAGTTTQEPAVYSDHDLRKQIRRSISTDTSFSRSARDVNISVRNGKVSLSGTVDTMEEKDRLTSKAESIVGAGNVDNQLKVRTTK